MCILFFSAFGSTSHCQTSADQDDSAEASQPTADQLAYIFRKLINDVGWEDLHRQDDLKEGRLPPANIDYSRYCDISLEDEALMRQVLLKDFYKERDLQYQLGQVFHAINLQNRNDLIPKSRALEEENSQLYTNMPDDLKKSLSGETFHVITDCLFQHAVGSHEVVVSSAKSDPNK